VRIAAKTFVITTFALVACGGGGTKAGPDSNGHGPDSSTPDTAGNVTTIKAIRMNQPANETMVTLQNVVVTAHVSSKKYGHVWVQDAGGGEYTGIQLFCNYGGTSPNCSMTQAQIDGLTIGAVVNVTGSFDNFLLGTAPAGAQANLELDAPTITATGQSGTATTVDVAPAVVAKDQLAMPAALAYAGSYIHVTGTSFPVSSIKATEFATTCTDMSMPAQTGATYDGFEATGGSAALAIGLTFYDNVTYCLPCTGVAMPYACANAVTTQTFTSVSGIVEPEYNTNGQVYLQISPTQDSDLTHN
jgi:hypothetical protein